MGAAEQARDLVDEAMDGDDEAEYDDEVTRPIIPADVADVHDVDHRREIPVDGGGMTLKMTPKMSDGEARQYLRGHLEDLRSRGISRVKVEELTDVLSATGMSASWLRKWVCRWAEDGPDALLRPTGERAWYEFRARAALPPT